MSLSDLQIGAWNVVGLSCDMRGANGEVYFVEGNDGSDDNDGRSWGSAFKTLDKAFDVSHANVASGKATWAKRNTIYIAGDTFSETLVVFPSKTDVVGCGSYDANTMAGITGHHAPVNTAYGTRFFNVWFKAIATASPIITLTSATSGVQFHGCVFDATAGTVTSGILATAHPTLKVKNCYFRGAFATSYISFGTGEAGGAEIVGNTMVDAAAAGIIVGAGTTTSWRAVIRDNFIQAATLIIDENADLFYIANNHLVSAAAVTGTAYAEAMDVNAKRCVGNWLTADNVTGPYPITDTTT